MTNKDYISTEQKIANSLAPAVDYLEYFVKGAYGMAVSILRIPTQIRKLKNKQLITQRDENLEKNGCTSVGFDSGRFIGISLILGEFAYTLSEAMENKNYIPLAIIGSTNLISGLYELGRSAGKKEGNLESQVNSPTENGK